MGHPGLALIHRTGYPAARPLALGNLGRTKRQYSRGVAIISFSPTACPRLRTIPLGRTMHIGLLTLEIHLPDSHSLKEKRLVLRSLKDRLKKFNVSVAECDHQDLWQRATLGVVSISSDHGILEKTLNAVIDETEKLILSGLTQSHIEYL